MAACRYCDQEMQDHVACTATTYDDFPDGVSRARLPYERGGGVVGGGGHCHDCGTPAGGLHHPGCDMERCPRCGGQAIACDC